MRAAGNVVNAFGKLATLLVMKNTRVSWMAMHFSTVQMVPFFPNGNFDQLHKFKAKTGVAGILASSRSGAKGELLTCQRQRLPT